MNPFIGMGMQLGGQLLAGRARKKAAEQMRRDAFDTGDDIVKATDQDQQRAIEYRNADQAAMDARGALGIDFDKLRADAERAGFNPLTALAATGGAGYDRPGVLTTPFISVADAFRDRANLVAGTGQARVETAGYFGDAFAGLGSNLIGLSADQAQRAHDMAMLQAQMTGATAARSLGSRNNGGGGIMGADRVTASPVIPGLPWWANKIREYVSSGYTDREHTKDPLRDTPLGAVITDADGHQTSGVNPDLDLDGPVSWLNSAWIVGSLFAQKAATHMSDVVYKNYDTWARPNPPKMDTGWTVNPSNGMWVVK